MKPVLLDASGDPIQRTAAFGDTAWNAASRGREMRDFMPSAGSADADSLGERDDIMHRARDLERNEAQALSGISVTAESVVGTGLTCIPQPDHVLLNRTPQWAEDWSRVVRAKYNSYCRSTDVDATGQETMGPLTAQVLKSFLLNGDVVSLPLFKPDEGVTQWGTTHLVIECDRLSNPDGGMDTEDLRGGVHIDPKTGKALGYWIASAHPGEVGMMGWTRTWEYIPAYTPWGRRRVIHIFDRRRFGQNRGVSFLANIIPEFHTLSRMKQAELQSALANSLISLIVKSNLPFEQVRDMFDSPEEYLSFRARNQPKLGSGATLVLAPGDEVEGFAPNRSATNFDAFMKSCLRQIFAGMNLPYELGGRDFAGMNYSNARMMLMEAWRAFDTRRYWLADRWCQPCYELWFEEAVAAGEIPDCSTDDLLDTPGAWQAWTRAEWVGPGRGWVDPQKEAEAARIRLASGLSTLQMEAAEQGWDWRDLAEQRHIERQFYASKGMPYPGDADLPGTTGTRTNDSERTYAS